MMYDENEAFSGSSAAHVLSARGPSTLGWRTAPAQVLSARGPSTLGWETAAAQVLSAWPKIEEFFGIEHPSELFDENSGDRSDL